jgi:hypothetical protein
MIIDLRQLYLLAMRKRPDLTALTTQFVSFAFGLSSPARSGVLVPSFLAITSRPCRCDDVGLAGNAIVNL